MLIKSCLLYVFMKGHIKVKSYHSATPKLNIPSQNCYTQSPDSPTNPNNKRRV